MVLNQTGSFGDLFFLPRASGANFLRALDQIVAGMWIIIYRTYLASRVPLNNQALLPRPPLGHGGRIRLAPHNFHILHELCPIFVPGVCFGSPAPVLLDFHTNILSSLTPLYVSLIFRSLSAPFRGPRYLSSMRCKLKAKHFM